MAQVVAAALCALLLSSCSFPGSVKTTVKIGLAAPFEGPYRDLGYEALYAVRLAVRQSNEAGGVGDRYLVELVALNDLNEADEAAQQVREMAADADVVGVLGGWSEPTLQASVLETQRLGLALLAPQPDWGRLAAAAAGFSVLNLGARGVAVVYSSGGGYEELARQFGAALTSHEVPVAIREVQEGSGWLADLGLDSERAYDLLFVAADAPTSARWMAQARRAGFQGSILGGPALGDPLLPDLAGEAAEGAFFVSHLAPAPDDLSFQEAYVALSGGPAPGPVAGWAYLAATHLLEVLDVLSGSGTRPTRAEVRAALEREPASEAAAYMYVLRDGKLGPVNEP